MSVVDCFWNPSREAGHIHSEFRIPNSEFQIYLIASFIDLTYS